jgi:hypothetical protein
MDWAEVEVSLQLTVSQSICQGIKPSLRLVTRYYFLSQGFCLKVGGDWTILFQKNIRGTWSYRLGEGWNASTVALQVVRDDVKGTQCPGV